MKDPVFTPIDLTAMQNAGVLMAANELFFWPLGLALTWDHDNETHEASNLHVRQWTYEDGHVESIMSEPDEAYERRRAAFWAWVNQRHHEMVEPERQPVEDLIRAWTDKVAP